MRIDDMGKLSVSIADRHGTYTGYKNKGCRCELCMKAAREYHRQNRITRAKRQDKWAIE